MIGAPDRSKFIGCEERKNKTNKILISLGEYCPSGWVVKRAGKEYAAVTCDPTHIHRKCPKPYSCVYSPCGMSFCCVNQSLSLCFIQFIIRIASKLFENSRNTKTVDTGILC
ncbi:unnamed protein product [Gongylonema pulchrum]|uniref:Uncharacterized protein n=1 Tax=Gongylonema pulchrum TaxID=637853 RepID=A0A183CZ65_9BILA|nr:unnamed protein product [Gongylonema pulchrum]